MVTTQAATSQPVQSPERSAQPSNRIMIVEDESVIALDIERRLQRAGYEVVGVADNKDDAVALYREHEPDLVLMDISIVGPADGIETARAIGMDVPIIFLTAYADDATLNRAAETSPYGYLLKPFDDRTLAATIKVALERHAADTRLRVMDAAVRTATAGIMLVKVTGAERTISYVNDAFVAMSGATRPEILGRRPCFLAVDPDDEPVARLRQAIDDCVYARETVRGRRMTGEDFWSSITVSPVPNQSGRVSHLLVFHMDITREREAQIWLAESQRLEVLGQLTAGIAHDFNNVLGAILAFTELAPDALAEASIASETIGDRDEVIHAVKRGTLLTRKLLDFARRQTPASSMTTSRPSTAGTADLTRVIAEARQMASRLAGPGISIELSLDPEPTFVSLDSTSLEQILLNLVSNARDAMQQGGKITIAVSRPVTDSGPMTARRRVRLEVTDSGTGMDAETASRIFNPFFTTKQRGLGTGLGLSTCQMLVERAGGTIRVKSTLGQGTTFTLDFPLADSTKSAHAEDLREMIEGNADGATCLLVEDEAPLRRAVGRALKSAGFTVIEASSGEAACRELDALGPTLRLLVCDMVLPGMGGREVIAHARKVSPHAELLVVTGYFDHSIESVGPGVPILWKPYTMTALARRALDLVSSHVEALPAEAAATTTPSLAVAANAVPVNDGRNPGVLLIEDDDAVRRALGAVLRSRGLRVHEAATAAAGLAAVAAEDVQLAVVDINLPDADGLEVLALIRKQDSLLPIVMMTGDASVANAQRAIRGRATAFLTKPIVPSAFVEEVERAMTEGQLARLQHKLFMSKAGSSAMLKDLAATEQSLKASVANLFAAYQPIVRAYDRSIFAYEALMRSRGPFVNPGELLSAAEALGAIEDIGRAVRQSIARTLSDQPSRFEPIFVNLHPMELRADLLLRDDEPLLPFASRIVLEVTERAKLSSERDLAETLRQLRAAGYRIALDDLGEGFAGLSWLVKLTPDIAKLDMSLVRNIEISRMKRDLVGSLVSVCRRSRTLLVAEGVETEAEAEILRDMGCDLLQGYLFARPGPPFPIVG